LLSHNGEAQARDNDQRERLENIDNLLSRLKECVKNVTPETKRQVVSQLLQEVRVGKDDKGNTTLRIICAFDGDSYPSSLYTPVTINKILNWVLLVWACRTLVPHWN